MRLPGSLLHLAIAASLVASTAWAERFAVFGDTRNNDAEHARIVAAMVKAHPDLAIFTGDAVLAGDRGPMWDLFLRLEQPLLSTIPFYPVRGNHDMGGLFEARFRMPPRGARGGLSYSFDALGLHFVGLDTELAEGPDSAVAFAQSDLRSPSGQPVVVFMHRPLYSSGRHGSDLMLRAALAPLFQAAGVATVFQGHDHDYERTHPIDGTTYFVEGGGGAPIHPFVSAAPEWSARRAASYGYLMVDVSPAALDVQAFDGDSLLIDRCSIPLSRREPQPAPLPPPAKPAMPQGGARPQRLLRPAVSLLFLCAAAAMALHRSRRKPA